MKVVVVLLLFGGVVGYSQGYDVAIGMDESDVAEYFDRSGSRKKVWKKRGDVDVVKMLGLDTLAVRWVGKNREYYVGGCGGCDCGGWFNTEVIVSGWDAGWYDDIYGIWYDRYYGYSNKSNYLRLFSPIYYGYR